MVSESRCRVFGKAHALQFGLHGGHALFEERVEFAQTKIRDHVIRFDRDQHGLAGRKSIRDFFSRDRVNDAGRILGRLHVDSRDDIQNVLIRGF